MSDFVDRFQARGAAIKSAYSAEETRPNRPIKGNLIVEVMADLALRARASGFDFQDCLAQAQRMAEYEWGFVGDEITNTVQKRRAVQAVAS